MPDPNDLLAQVRATAQGYDVFGELGRKSDDDVWFLARERGQSALVALRLKLEAPEGGGPPVRSLEVAKELGSQVAMDEGDCWKCQSRLRSFARFCSRCGADQTKGTKIASSEAERVELLAEVKAAAGAAYEVIGEMSWGGGGGAIYFAIEAASGELVRLRVRQGDDGIELGETEVGLSLGGHLTAAYVSGANPGEVAARKPIVRRASAPPAPPGSSGRPSRAVEIELPPAGTDGAAASPASAKATWSARERILLIGVIGLGVLVLALAALVLSRQSSR